MYISFFWLKIKKMESCNVFHFVEPYCLNNKEIEIKRNVEYYYEPSLQIKDKESNDQIDRDLLKNVWAKGIYMLFEEA